MKIHISVHPGTKNPRIIVDNNNLIHVYVRERPIEGKANIAVRKALAEKYHTSPGNVRLISGEKSKSKLFEIEDN